MDGRPLSARGRADAGFSLVEILVALFIISIGLLAVAPMFVTAKAGNAKSGDLGSLTAIAVERMEQMRSREYAGLIPGGSLDANLVGYFDDSIPEVVIRLEIADLAAPAGARSVSVRAIGREPGQRRPAEVNLTTLRVE